MACEVLRKERLEKSEESSGNESEDGDQSDGGVMVIDSSENVEDRGDQSGEDEDEYVTASE